MNVAYVAVGALSVIAGAYVYRNPEGRWNRFAAEHTEMWRDPDAEEKMARGAPVVGGLLILGGLFAALVGVAGA